MNTDAIIKKNEDYLITETVLDSSVSIEKLISVVRSQRTTGQLTLSLKEGGIRTIVLIERTRATSPERDKIREILGMQ
jgi:hypothetical protein